jgi:hypothetical protein
MNPIVYRTLATAITLSILSGCVVAPPGPPEPPIPVGFVGVDFVDAQGYKHHGYYDDHHAWHGGYYDANHQRHDDPPDWHH